MSKIPLLLFSGGLDSTTMLATQLMKGPCDVLYVRGHQHPDKIAAELTAREKMFAVINSQQGYKVRKQYDIKVDMGFVPYKHQHKFNQPLTWIIGAMMVMEPASHSELQIGYCDGDGMLTHLHDVEIAWNALWQFTKMGESPPVVFPLRYRNKVEMLGALPPELLAHIWVCEMPSRNAGRVVPCGYRCTPCRRNRAVAEEYKYEHGIYPATRVLRSRAANTDFDAATIFERIARRKLQTP
jgi:hypothetical protein